LGDELSERVELRLEHGSPSELDVLLIAHLNQEGLHPRETLRDWLHNGGHDRLTASTTSIVSRHSGHCTCWLESPAVPFCTLLLKGAARGARRYECLRIRPGSGARRDVALHAHHCWPQAARGRARRVRSNRPRLSESAERDLRTGMPYLLRRFWSAIRWRRVNTDLSGPRQEPAGTVPAGVPRPGTPRGLRL